MSCSFFLMRKWPGLQLVTQIHLTPRLRHVILLTVRASIGKFETTFTLILHRGSEKLWTLSLVTADLSYKE
jgi:hypothetical protein